MNSSMSDHNVQTNLFYNAFGQGGLPGSFIFVIGIRWFIGILGFLLNFSLLWVTWRTKSLRESCNFLIAANALFAGIFGLSLTIGWVLILTGHPFQPMMACFQLQALPLLCRNVGLNTLLFIGIDRLVCVLRPAWRRNTLGYFLTISVLSASHALFIVFSCLKMALDMPDLPILCSTHDDVYQQGGLAVPLFYVNVCLSVVILTVYFLLWIAVKAKKTAYSASSTANTRKLLNSMMAIMSMLVAGFILNNMVNILYIWFSFSTGQKAYIAVVLAWLPALAYGSNAPLLIAFSSEYRKAYAKVFPFLCCFNNGPAPQNAAAAMAIGGTFTVGQQQQKQPANMPRRLMMDRVRWLEDFGRRGTYPIAPTSTTATTTTTTATTTATVILQKNNNANANKQRAKSIVPYH